MTEKRKYDSTIARMAGNIAAGMCTDDQITIYSSAQYIASKAVEIARAIVAEVERTTPEAV